MQEDLHFESRYYTKCFTQNSFQVNHENPITMLFKKLYISAY